MKPTKKRLLILKLRKIRLLSKRFIITTIFIVAFITMFLNKKESAIIYQTTSVATNLVSPIIEVLSLPAKIITNNYNYLTSLKKTYKENTILKTENHELNYLKHKIKSLEIENKLLGDLLNYIPPKESNFYTAKVISAENTAFSNSLIVYTGENKNIKTGQIAVNNEGVVGRVENVGKSYSTINLLTDINIKIPVIIERNRTKAILIGNNTDLNQLIFFPINTDIEKGDTIITSGIAGVFPPGLPIGKVSGIEGNIYVKPFANLKKVEYLQIIDFEPTD